MKKLMQKEICQVSDNGHEQEKFVVVVVMVIETMVHMVMIGVDEWFIQ